MSVFYLVATSALSGTRSVTVGTNGVCVCWLSGGVVGTKYTIRNHITTSRGMEDDVSTTIKIKEQ